MEQTPSSSKKGKDFWGGPLWDTIHILAATLRPENSEKFREFLFLMSDLIPCDYCAKNLKIKLKKYPPEKWLRNNHDAFFYSYFLHDLVNQDITKTHPGMPPKLSPPFDDIKVYYFRALGEKCKDCEV